MHEVHYHPIKTGRTFQLQYSASTKNPTMPNLRKLVTLREIASLRRMKGPRYKAYDVATVGGGWTVVVYHGDFSIGEMILYFEIDSFIPATNVRFKWEDESALTEFQGEKGYHVASQMLDKQLSQGLVQAVSAFPEVQSVLDRLIDEYGFNMGRKRAKQMSFEEALGVKKWEVPCEAKGRILGSVPRFFPRPACERIQNMSNLFSYKNLNTTFQITEKLDGVSMSVYHVTRGSKWHKSLPVLAEGSTQHIGGVRMGVASAAQDLDEQGNDVYWQAAKKLGLPAKLQQMGLGNVAVQGELIGPTVKNNNSLNFAEDADHEFIVFQIFDIDKQHFLHPAVAVEICERLGMPHVPIIGYMSLREFATTLEEMLTKAEGTSMRGTTREGLVFKSMREEEFAFKVISNKWLLEQGE